MSHDDNEPGITGDQIAIATLSMQLTDIILAAESWDPSALNQQIVCHPSVIEADREYTADQVTQGVMQTLHLMLQAIEQAGIREEVQEVFDVG